MIKIETKVGNLLHVKSGHIVHGCNAQGVMGSGVALGVKQTWPHVFQDYRRVFAEDGLVLGEAYPVLADKGLIVWNAITQDAFGAGSRHTSYEAIATCFEAVNRYIHDIKDSQENKNLLSFHQDVVITPAEVHIPMIGAARGGGNWRIISTIIEETMDFPVTLWMPDSTVTTL